MHELPDGAGRPRRGQCHGSAAAAILAVAAMALGLLANPPGPKAASPDADPMITGSISTAAPVVADHELRIEFTRAGAEGLELAARLDERGGLVTRPVRWTVKRAIGGSAAAGEPVFSAEAPVADLRLRPGEYRIEANYGLAHIAHEVTIHPGQWVGVTLILHVGGVRALSLVENQHVPMSITAAHRIYALSGRQSGKRLTATGQGELARLEAGDYRVESRFEPGNAVAETTLAVKPGVLSSVQIAHLAGLVRVEFPGGGNDEGFEVRALDSRWAWRGRSPGGDLVLAPGRYEARALTGAARVGFEVAEGDAIVVLLDP
jgi:acyl-coenzyme A thioesterase PaaI-like protein